MSGQAEIRIALETRLTAAAPGAAVPASRLALPNRSFVKGTTRWYRGTYIPGEPVAAAIGGDAPNFYKALYKIDIFDPINIGEVPAEIEAERIAACFKRGTTLTYGGVTVSCEKAYRQRGDSDNPAWFMTSVIVEVQAETAN